MTFPFFRYHPQQEAPFTLFIEHRDQTRDGHWRPAAFVMLTSSLRTSGFLWALPPEELKSFLLLLSFVSSNGGCSPTLPQLAKALKQSEAKTRARMERLAAVRWHDQPIVLSHRLGNGLEAFAPLPGLLPVREEEPTARVDTAPLYRAAPREAIIEYSRRTYARPRAEVERQIAEQMGWKLPSTAVSSSTLVTPDAAAASPSDDAEHTLRQELIQVGLLPEQADDLLSRFDPVRIQRQLMWLPYRRVRNRTGFLMAAVKDDYEAPPNMGHAKVSSNEADFQETVDEA